ncbi:acyl-CoA dehydrogenase [Luteitalea sp. TBR-22]|uniref:acyl-CoA dehydrogenase family protein n=1 Tax=Luteitalea sp. TBR-22 TaxID=2802971 RepID=UPI001AF102F8|nr:acyl-CoA dehydrogenase family protein [Luteitalea sp. TBR-22]BCS34196.1 acyl-CoA dehydrogenase [Luteitalea sp. TBR-22]
MTVTPTDRQAAFAARARQFAEAEVAPRAAAIDADNTFPRDLVARAGALGLMGATIPEAWGGAGQDEVAYVLALEAIARASATVAVILSVNTSLVAETLLRHGSDAQRERWLRRLATGASVGAFALSEADAGSDAANQQTVAVADQGGYRLRGRKVWVANAAAADVVIVFASTRPDLRGRGISAFLVPMDAPGLSRHGLEDSLGVRGLGCMDLVLDDVRVEADHLLGGAGQGFAIAREALDGGRVAIAAQALGVGEASLAEAIAYAKRRVAFGQPIASYQAIQFMLADMATGLEAARMLTWRAAAARARGARATTEASMAKLAASEAAHAAADRALQILASEGYRHGATVERLFRDVRATEIYQGTSEVQRMIIADAVLA